MLSATEYHMKEALPLYEVHAAILDFCRGRRDAVVFGAQAVNLHVATPRMTQDVNLLSPRPREVAQALAAALHERFQIAIRVREVAAGRAFRVYQLRAKEGNRHLADVRLAEFLLEDLVERDGIRYVPVALSLAMKAVSYSRRRHAPKGATDLADLRRLLLAHPEFATVTGPVDDAIHRIGGDQEALSAWKELLDQPLVSDEAADEGY